MNVSNEPGPNFVAPTMALESLEAEMNIDSDGPDKVTEEQLLQRHGEAQSQSRYLRDGLRDTRPGWAVWAMGIAEAAAVRADCSRRQVGAVILTPDRRLIQPGYNGAPAGMPGCLTAGACPRASSNAEGLVSSYSEGATRCIALHAEANVLLRASWDDMVESTLYVTCEPCYQCKVLIMGTPLAAVIWKEADGSFVRRWLDELRRMGP